MQETIKMYWNFVKSQKRLHKPSLFTLYHFFVYSYLIYYNQVWGNNYPTAINKLVLIQKKLVRIITYSPYIAHTEPLMYANKMLSVSDINRYLTGTFMYQFIHKEAPERFLNLFHTNSNFHDHDTRHSEDLNVPYGRIDVRKFSIKIHGAKLWNSIPDQIKNAQSIYMFKQQFRNYLIELWVLCHNYFKCELYWYLIWLCLLMNHVLCWFHVDLSYLFHLTLRHSGIPVSL